MVISPTALQIPPDKFRSSEPGQEQMQMASFMLYSMAVVSPEVAQYSGAEIPITY